MEDACILMNLIIVLFIVAALVALLWRGSKGPSRSFEELKQSIQDLYDRGYDGELLTISRLSRKKFIQLRKYALKNENGIEIIIPNAKWSASIFPGVEHAFKEKRYRMRFQVAQRK